MVLLRAHTAETPYKSKECGEKILKHSFLKLHMRPHLERDSDCDRHEKAFSSISSLTGHK